MAAIYSVALINWFTKLSLSDLVSGHSIHKIVLSMIKVVNDKCTDDRAWDVLHMNKYLEHIIHE